MHQPKLAKILSISFSHTAQAESWSADGFPNCKSAPSKAVPTLYIIVHVNLDEKMKPASATSVHSHSHSLQAPNKISGAFGLHFRWLLMWWWWWHHTNNESTPKLSEDSSREIHTGIKKQAERTNSCGTLFRHPIQALQQDTNLMRNLRGP